MQRRVIVDRVGAARGERDGLAGGGIVVAVVARAAKHEEIRGTHGQGIAVPGIGVVLAKVLLGGGAGRPIAPPIPHRRSQSRVVPAGDVAVALVGEVNLARFPRKGGAARGHLALVVGPLVGIHVDRGRHAFGHGVHARRRDGPADMRRVVEVGGPVLHRDASAKLLVRGAHGATIPHADRHARAGDRKGRRLQQAGAR